MPNEFYEEKHAEAILKLASERDVSSTLTRERLYSTAAELGISAEAVAAAERQLESQQIDTSLQDEFKANQRHNFLSSLYSFIGTNAFMVGIWYVSGHGNFWPVWLMVAWGFGILMEIPRKFFVNSEDYQKEYKKWLKKREKREAKEAELLKGR